MHLVPEKPTSGPLVSVVIPTYNRGFCVGRAIGSVLQQTRPACEVIVVDDGSGDDTREVVQSFGAPVEYLFQPNAGVSAARNAGVQRARGDWIAFLDSDDEWLPEKLHVQCTDLAAHPEAIAHMVDCSLAGENGIRQSIFELRGLRQDFEHQPLRMRPLRDVLASAFFPSSWLVRRAAIERAGYFDASMRLCEDTDLLSRVALQGPFCVNGFVGTRLLRHEGSGALSDLYRQSRLEYFGNILKTHRHLLDSPRLSRAERSHVCKELAATHVEIALLHRMNGDSAECRRALMASLATTKAVFPLLKVLALMGLGAHAYQALRRLKLSHRSAPVRRSAAG